MIPDGQAHEVEFTEPARITQPGASDVVSMQAGSGHTPPTAPAEATQVRYKSLPFQLPHRHGMKIRINFYVGPEAVLHNFGWSPWNGVEVIEKKQRVRIGELPTTEVRHFSENR